MTQNPDLLDPDDVRLSLLLLEMRNEGFDTPRYRPFTEAACDGRFPAKQHNGRWFANRKDKGKIAAAMRMELRHNPKASGNSAKRRAAASQPAA